MFGARFTTQGFSTGFRPRACIARFTQTLTIVFACILLLVSARQSHAAPNGCKSPKSALGISRTVEIDTTQGPGFGVAQYRHFDFLKDREVVLTFDDGPIPRTTKKILKALKHECTKALFFPLGKMALAYPSTLRQVIADGHTVGIHGWSHPNMPGKSLRAATDDIEIGASAVRLAAGRPIAPFFRFPYLSDSQKLIDYLAKRDLGVFSIGVDSKDYLSRSSDALVNSVMKKLKRKGKGILLLHDIHAVTANALPKLLRRLRTDGYQIVHVTSRYDAKTLAKYDEKVRKLRRKRSRPVADAGGRPMSQVVRTVSNGAASALKPVASGRDEDVATNLNGLTAIAEQSKARSATTTTLNVLEAHLGLRQDHYKLMIEQLSQERAKVHTQLATLATDGQSFETAIRHYGLARSLLSPDNSDEHARLSEGLRGVYKSYILAAPDSKTAGVRMDEMASVGVKPGSDHYEAVISKCGNYKEAFHWLNRTQSEGFALTGRSYAILANLAPDPATTLVWFRRMTSLGVQPDQAIFEKLIVGAGTLAGARQWIEKMQAAGHAPTERAVASLVGKAADYIAARHLVADLQRGGLELAPPVYAALDAKFVDLDDWHVVYGQPVFSVDRGPEATEDYAPTALVRRERAPEPQQVARAVPEAEIEPEVQPVAKRQAVDPPLQVARAVPEAEIESQVQPVAKRQAVDRPQQVARAVPEAEVEPEVQPTAKQQPADLAQREASIVSIVVVGDTGLNANRKSVKSNGFKRWGRMVPWRYSTQRITDKISSDIAIANLETVVTDSNDLRATSKKFNFRSHPEGIRHLVSAGFNAFTLANNHSYDYGTAGVRETLNHVSRMTDAGLLGHSGLGFTKAAAASPVLFEAKSTRFALSSIGIGANGNSSARALADRPGQLNYSDLADVRDLSARLKSATADYRMLAVHYGREREVRPRYSERQKLRQIQGRGDVDLIIGHHAHVARAVEINDGKVIFYGLGNFLHPGTARLSKSNSCKDFGLIGKVHLEVAPGTKPKLRAVEIIPIKDTHKRPSPMKPSKARKRIAIVNGLARELDDARSGARGLRFAPTRNGTGLACLPGSESAPEPVATMCRELSGHQNANASEATVSVASCGRTKLKVAKADSGDVAKKRTRAKTKRKIKSGSASKKKPKSANRKRVSKSKKRRIKSKSRSRSAAKSRSRAIKKKTLQKRKSRRAKIARASKKRGRSVKKRKKIRSKRTSKQKLRKHNKKRRKKKLRGRKKSRV